MRLWLQRMVILKIQTTIFPEKMAEFEQAMNHLLHYDETKKMKYLKGFYQEWHNPNAFFYLEEWESDTKLKHHLKSDSFKAFLGAMKVLGEIVSAKVIHTSQIEDL